VGEFNLANGGVGLLSASNRKMEDMLEGEAVLIGRDGAFFDQTLRRNRVGQADIEQALRQADCTRQEMQFAFLEVDGSITILKRSKEPEQQPSTPS